MSRNNCEMSNVSGCNYDLQNVECQSLIPSCKISSRSPRFAKRTIMDLSGTIMDLSGKHGP